MGTVGGPTPPSEPSNWGGTNGGDLKQEVTDALINANVFIDELENGQEVDPGSSSRKRPTKLIKRTVFGIKILYSHLSVKGNVTPCIGLLFRPKITHSYQGLN